MCLLTQMAATTGRQEISCQVTYSQAQKHFQQPSQALQWQFQQQKALQHLEASIFLRLAKYWSWLLWFCASCFSKSSKTKCWFDLFYRNMVLFVTGRKRSLSNTAIWKQLAWLSKPSQCNNSVFILSLHLFVDTREFFNILYLFDSACHCPVATRVEGLQKIRLNRHSNELS